MRAFLRARRAGAALEFAFCGAALLAMIFVVLDLGDLGLVLGAMTYSTEVTARAAALQTSTNLAAGQAASTACIGQPAVVALFNSALPSILPQATSGGTGVGKPAVTSSWVQGASSTGTSLMVTTNFSWVPFGLPSPAVPLSVSETQMLVGSSGSVATQCS